jgi:beta-fructofuranosidase
VVFIPEEHYLWDFWLVSPQEWRDQHALYHLFYLQAPRSLHDPDLRHRMATVGHAVSSDLRHWVHRGTGSVTIRDGLAYMFYTALSKAEQAPVQRIGLAISSDLVHWERHPGNPLLEVDTRWYEQQNTRHGGIQTWRDPHVVYASEEQAYYMFFSARVNEGSHDGRAVIGLARSTNLLSWEVLPPVSIPGDFTEMEVPQVVALNGRYYLLFCVTIHATAHESPSEARGWVGTHYLVADKLTGPYRPLTNEPLVADAAGTYYAGKLVQGSAGTHVFMAWRHWDEEGNFCGGLSDPAEVHVLPDGRLHVDQQQLWAV